MLWSRKTIFKQTEAKLDCCNAGLINFSLRNFSGHRNKEEKNKNKINSSIYSTMGMTVHWRYKKYMQNFCLKISRGETVCGDLDFGGKIILQD